MGNFLSDDMRTCGECVACCKVMSVDELKKPASVWCEHCEIGKGCKIYSDRPQSCIDFRCLWLTDSRLPDSMRPDRSKVIFHVDKETKVLKVHVDPDRPDAWKKGLCAEFIAKVRMVGVDVMVVCGLKKNLRKQYCDNEKNLSPR